MVAAGRADRGDWNAAFNVAQFDGVSGRSDWRIVLPGSFGYGSALDVAVILGAPILGSNLSMFSALLTRSPRIKLTTNRIFLVEVGILLSLAIASIALLVTPVLSSYMSPEGARRSKFSQLVSNHVFCDINGDEFISVMHSKSVTDKIRGNH